MQLLRKKGLHGSGLVKISSSRMIDRYNKALVSMGFEPTNLDCFSVDMLGWSPEIAWEKGNIYYLTHSLANPMAIIININQRHAPVYFPYHSFDREMISNFFSRFTSQIMDITTSEALCIDLDNGVSKYTTLDDLLLVNSFVMRVETPNRLINGAHQQQQLISQFIESEVFWEDEKKRQELIDSSKRYGDLRNRQISIPHLVYTELDLFYTEALGGVYILKQVLNSTQKFPFVIIYKNQAAIKSLVLEQNQEVRVAFIRQPKLLRDLTKADFFQMDLKTYQNNPALLDYKKELLLANYICTHEESYIGWSEMKKKNYIARHAQDIPELYFIIERVQKRLASGEKFYSIPLTPALIAYFTVPHPKLPVLYRSTLQHLLSELDPSDPIRLFKYNKKRFYHEYKKSPECKKQWMAELLELSPLIK
ncbi:MAG: hypothetical protein D3923_12685 [Candidatus Electrothrix sp. AR3]|nr:hypothetical protein [Candidatus Electrothrix sp. AR3]